MKALDPKEAVDRIRNGDLADAYFQAAEFCACFKLTPEQFRREAKSGRLRVLMPRGAKHPQFSDFVIKAEDALEWLVRQRKLN